MAKGDYLKTLMHDLESHTEVRRFGSGWLSGFFGLLFAIAGFFMVIALRFPDWFATPELEIIKNWGGFRGAVHLVLLVSYGLSLLSLLLRPRKVLGLTALMIGLAVVGGRALLSFGLRSAPGASDKTRSQDDGLCPNSSPSMQRALPPPTDSMVASGDCTSAASRPSS